MYLADDPRMNPGTLVEVNRQAREGLVFWDSDFGVRQEWRHANEYPEDRWYPLEYLRIVTGPRPNPSLILAPEVQDLEFVPRLDPKTGLRLLERDPNYRGDEAPGPRISSGRDIYKLFKEMRQLPSEHIVTLLMNVRGELIGWTPAGKGGHHSVEASPREILQDALFANAYALALIHNHPSGDASPSKADKDLTRSLATIAEGLEVELLDHVIVGGPRPGQQPYFSFREAGLVKDPS